MSNVSDIEAVKLIMSKVVVNRYSDLGQIHVMDPLDDEYGFDVKPRSDDIVIYTDFNDCDLTEEEEREQLADWYYNTLHYSIEKQMKMFGYQAIAGHDGSSTGLYCGATLFRKRMT
jgi:hypothetical protein